MRRYMKVLASTSALGMHMAISHSAYAQEQCPPIPQPCVVSVPRGPAPCPVGAYCSSDPGGYGYTGGGGSGGSNSIPENEGTTQQPAPAPAFKSPEEVTKWLQEQKAAQKAARCEEQKKVNREAAPIRYASDLSNCGMTAAASLGFTIRGAGLTFPRSVVDSDRYKICAAQADRDNLQRLENIKNGKDILGVDIPDCQG